MKRLIQRFDLRGKARELSDTDLVRLTVRTAQILRAVEQQKEPPEVWYDRRGRRWEIWDLVTGVNWR